MRKASINGRVVECTIITFGSEYFCHEALAELSNAKLKKFEDSASENMNLKLIEKLKQKLTLIEDENKQLKNKMHALSEKVDFYNNRTIS